MGRSFFRVYFGFGKATGAGVEAEKTVAEVVRVASLHSWPPCGTYLRT